jgi:Cu/Ag efflux pump CusA
LLAVAAAIAALAVPQLLQLAQPAPRVELYVEWSGGSAIETEELVTFQLESAINGLPNLTNTRTLSTANGSYLALTFDHRTSLADAKRLVAERLRLAEMLPTAAVPQFSPLTDAHELLRYTVVGKDDRSISAESQSRFRGEVSRRLRAVPGVADVSTSGDRRRRVELVVDPDRLMPYPLSLNALRMGLAEQIERMSNGGSLEGIPSDYAQAVADMVIHRGKEGETHARDIASVRLGSAPTKSMKQRLNRDLPGASWRTTRAAPGPWWGWWSNHSGQAVVKIFGDNLQELQWD